MLPPSSQADSLKRRPFFPSEPINLDSDWAPRLRYGMLLPIGVSGKQLLRVHLCGAGDPSRSPASRERHSFDYIRYSGNPGLEDLGIRLRTGPFDAQTGSEAFSPDPGQEAGQGGQEGLFYSR